MTGRRQRDRAATEAEVNLWRQAVADAAPIAGRKQVPLQKPHVHPSARRRAVEPTGPLVPPAVLRQPEQIDRATLTRLKKGRLPIDAKLDLHGMTAASAERNLRAFLRSSQAAGHRAVLVITGRGLDPEGLGRGVLKRAAPDWLAAMSDLVSGFNEADRRHGGAGALYVRIRRKDKAKRI